LKHSIKLLLVFVVLFSIAASQKSVRILMAGDSTMAQKPLFKNVFDSISGDSIPVQFQERGWGMLLPECFTDGVQVLNFAQNGRSTNRFIREGWWAKLMNELQKGDFVVIQFAHNDGAKDKPDRYTTPEEYETNLIRMVGDVRRKGGKPILCTAVMRRKFDADGHIVDTHGVYPELTRKVAKALKVPCIDLQKSTTEWLEREGVVASASNFHQLEPGESKLFPNGLKDNTHYNEKGARMAASFFVEGIKQAGIQPLIRRLRKEFR
jgi:lysophospholipase L1-like esterase